MESGRLLAPGCCGERCTFLANTNQFWGLRWGIFVFGELPGKGRVTYLEVTGGSLWMIHSVGAIALSSATSNERTR
jgi:hypothetical protein